MAEPNLDELTSVTLTTRERVLVARVLIIAAALADMIGTEPCAMVDLSERFRPDGVAL